MTFPHLAKQSIDQKASFVIDLAQAYNFTHLEQLDEQKRDELRELVRKEVV